MEDNGNVVSFLFPVSSPVVLIGSISKPSADTIDVMVERTSLSNIFFPFVSLFDTSLSLSDVRPNFTEVGGSRWL
jgi:hypothetical protein